MVRYSLPLALLLASACAAIPVCAQQTSPQQNKKVWTNADMAGLRERGLISVVGMEAEATSAAISEPVPAETSAPVYESRLQDPAWYADQAADLQTELYAQLSTLAQAQTNLTDARSLRGATGGFNMAATDDAVVSPEENLAILEARARDTQALLDDLAELARQNDIPAGVLRSAGA